MRELKELINTDDSAWPIVQELACKVPGRCEILPASETAGDVLFRTQVTTRSPMGAIAYHTGGLLLNHRWLRILGSGIKTAFRSLPDWNVSRSEGFFLVADDAAGGFFAIDGGQLGFQKGHICYWAPDRLEWISLDGGYTEFLTWACSGDLDQFYRDLRWPNWESDAQHMDLDRCMSFYPFLWTKEGSVSGSRRATVPVAEAFDMKVDIVRQLSQ
jgi:hypothetical protein